MKVIVYVKKAIAAMAAAYIPSVLISALILGGNAAADVLVFPYWLSVLALFLISFPLFAGGVEIILSLVRLPESSARQRVHFLFVILPALAAILTFLLDRSLIFVSGACAVVLVLLEVIHQIMEKKRGKRLSFIRQRSFWLLAAALIVLTALGSLALAAMIKRGWW